MIKNNDDELLITELNEATNPLNSSINMTATVAFCEQILKKPKGSNIAVPLLAHKLQSPQEKEALYTFDVIDECIKRCGPEFHKEIGRFKFLNEMIKVISPKYLGKQRPMDVKNRCIECLYGLYKGIPHEKKFEQAYTILKQEGCILHDPTYLDSKIFKVSDHITETKKSIFETSKDSERLTRLLKSSNPDDRKEANRIIKNIVLTDNNKIEQLSISRMKLETMKSNTVLLQERLKQYKSDEVSAPDLSIMKELVGNLETSRSEMFKLIRDSNDDDLRKEIEIAIENSTAAIRHYWDRTESDTGENVTDNVMVEDLLGDAINGDPLSVDLQSISIPDTYTIESSSTADFVNTIPTTKYDGVTHLFNSQIIRDANSSINGESYSNYSSASSRKSSQSANCGTKDNTLPNRKPPIDYKGFEELDLLYQEIINLSKRNHGNSITSNSTQDVELLSSLDWKEDHDYLSNDLPLLCDDLSLENLQTLENHLSDSILITNDSQSVNNLEDITNNDKVTVEEPTIDLSSFDLNLSDIKPHPHKKPLVIYSNDETKVKATLYFGNDRPHPNVSVMVAQISAESNDSVTDVALKFAVSKPMKIRTLKASGNVLSAHSPFAPSPPINEIVLLYHPNQDSADLKFHLSYELNGEEFLESETTRSIEFF